LAEEHLVASTRERIINLLRENLLRKNALYFDPEVDTHQYYPSEAFIESILLDDPDYLLPPDSPDFEPEISWPFEDDPSNYPDLYDASFTCPEQLLANMLDASPSKRRKTNGAPMKTKKSFGKQVASH
jgi:hypothetical protein